MQHHLEKNLLDELGFVPSETIAGSLNFEVFGPKIHVTSTSFRLLSIAEFADAIARTEAVERAALEAQRVGIPGDPE